MESPRMVIGIVAVLLGTGSAAAAQEPAEEGPPVPCREQACRLEMDWRNGVPNVIDRRYGNPYEFERHLVGHLQSAGYAFVGEGGDADAVIVRLRPEMMRAMCDLTPGTDTDMSCQTVGEVRVDILNTDPGLDIKHSLRIRGRCGADELMDVERMSEYVAAVIDYELHRGEDRRRPSTRC